MTSSKHKFKSDNYTFLELRFYSFRQISMAYSRFSRRSFGRSRYSKFSRGRGSRYGRKGGSWMNRNQSAAKQMAGFQNVQIVHIETLTHTIPNGGASPISAYFSPLNIGTIIADSNMHEQLSNVYDQFRIRKVTIKATPLLTAQDSAGALNTTYYTFFTVLDRNGFAAGDDTTLETLQTYQSYKQTPYSTMASNKAPTHWMSYYNSSLFEKSRWYNTKKTPVDATVMAGTYARSVEGAGNRTAEYQLEYTFDVTYRGLRMDLSEITTSIDVPQ